MVIFIKKKKNLFIRLFYILTILTIKPLLAQNGFFTLSIGPDLQVKTSENSFTHSRFRTNIELGTDNRSFVLQPAYGDNTTSIFVGMRFISPVQIGNAPLFVVPDLGGGVDFGFSDDTMGLALDIKFGARLFYEIQNGLALVFRPFGLNVRFFNIWLGGDKDNQTKASVTYEIQIGFTYFF